jgi:hypothetical protein
MLGLEEHQEQEEHLELVKEVDLLLVGMHLLKDKVQDLLKHLVVVLLKVKVKVQDQQLLGKVEQVLKDKVQVQQQLLVQALLRVKVKGQGLHLVVQVVEHKQVDKEVDLLQHLVVALHKDKVKDQGLQQLEVEDLLLHLVPEVDLRQLQAQVLQLDKEVELGQLELGQEQLEEVVQLLEIVRLGVRKHAALVNARK